jgi:uncharacterized repeat protein (TIGR03803 family)
VEGPDGALYGTTFGAGWLWLSDDLYGSIFRFGTDGSVRRLHAFNAPDGEVTAALSVGADGALYGITDGQYSGVGGMVFRLQLGECSDADDCFRTLHTFDGASGQPRSALVRGRDGTLYGAAGAEVFAIEVGGAYRRLRTLTSAEGVDGHVVLGQDGALYGTTGADCVSCDVFRIDTGGEVRTLYSWSPPNVGPSALVEGPDGAFYGITARGASTGGGTVFRVEGAGGFAVLQELGEGTTSRYPLFAARDGALYGTTTDRFPSVFRIDTLGHFRTIHAIDPRQDGYEPGALFEDAAGALYGFTSWGGPLGGGTLFRIALSVPGDVNGDGAVSVADVFSLIGYLFAGGAAPEGSADVNGDGRTDVQDVFYLISFLFAGGLPPV